MPAKSLSVPGLMMPTDRTMYCERRANCLRENGRGDAMRAWALGWIVSPFWIGALACPVMAFVPRSGSTVVVSQAIHDDLYLAGGTVMTTAAVDGDVVAAGGTVDLTGVRRPGALRPEHPSPAQSSARPAGNVRHGNGRSRFKCGTRRSRNSGISTWFRPRQPPKPSCDMPVSCRFRVDHQETFCKLDKIRQISRILRLRCRDYGAGR